MKLPLLYAAALALLCPLVSGQQIKLLPSDGAPGDAFGYSAAISGNIGIVGARYSQDINGIEVGAAYLFDSTTGIEYAKLGNDETSWTGFGMSVGISDTIAIVGAYSGNGGSGSAYLFDATTGNQLAELLPNDGALEDFFGYSVGISGTIAIVGAHRDDDNGGNSGSVYLFDATTGAQIAKLLPSDGTSEDRFGISVAISGTTAIVGASEDDENGLYSGSAYLFDATTGNQLDKLFPSDAAPYSSFGYSVAISGTTAIVGSLNEVAYLFDTTTGNQLAVLQSNDWEWGDYFGYPVDISGTTAIVGANGNDDYGSRSGSAYLFDTTSGSQIVKLLPDDGDSQDWFGFSVAFDGVTPLVGALRDEDNGGDSGSAYLFLLDCDNNGIIDVQDIANTPSLDCDNNGHIDDCELASGVGDCNLNGIFDACECLTGSATDCNDNLIPDICEALDDCNSDGFPDDCQNLDDCNSNGTPDACESLPDCNTDGTPDECQSLDDCDKDGELDVCEISNGSEPDLNTNGIPDSCECLASNYCTASPNTAGSGVQINITGIPSIALNSLGIDATGGPVNQPGLFFHGPGTANQPFGEGIRCVSTPILRVELPVFFGPGGTTSKHIDMTATAQSSIQPADTRYFQFWYRDPQGGLFGFNLSNGLEITFCP